MSPQILVMATAALFVSLFLAIIFLVKDPIFFVSRVSSQDNPRVNPALLRVHVEKLSQDFFPRSTFHATQLNQTADYIKSQWESFGLTVIEQSFRIDSLSSNPYRNILVQFPGTSSDLRPLVIGAHYDAIEATPGADDNASGVAGLLELARLLAKSHATIPILLIAYPNEEMPNFGGQGMGSYQHAWQLVQSKQEILGMLSLEMLGTYLYERNSQAFPLRILRLLYPTQGNFITFASSIENYSLLHLAKKLFVKASDFPIESFIGPKTIQGLMNSDHSSYIQFGFPAFMVTDTAYYRNIRYHTANDTADTLDYDSMARVVEGLYGMLLLWR